MQTTKATAVESEIERLKTRIDSRAMRKNRHKFKARHGDVIRVADAKDILKAKTEADKLQVETRAQRQAYIAQQRAKIKSAEYIYESDECFAKDDNCNYILITYVHRMQVRMQSGRLWFILPMPCAWVTT